jgi:outer membrane protein TolC
MKRTLFGMVLLFALPFFVFSADVTFDEALKTALSKNAEITKAAADLKISKATVEKTYGMFDVMLDSGVTYSKSKSEATSPFSPDGTDVLGYRVSLAEKIFTGGFLSLALDSSRTTLFYPDMDMGIPGFDPSIFQSAVNPSYAPKLSLTYSQPLLKGFWGRPDEKAIKIGDLSVAISKEGLRSKVTGQVASLKEAFYFVYLAQELYAVQKKFYDDAEKFFNQTKKLRAIGLREEKDVLQTEASLISSKGELNPAEDNIRFAKEMFLNLAGYPQESWSSATVVTQSAVETADLPASLTAELEDMLADSQPEVKIVKTAMEIAKTAKEMADNNSLPSLDLFGSYSVNGVENALDSAYREMGEGKYNSYAFGANLKFNLPDRASSGERANSGAALSKAEADYAFLRNMAKINLRSAYHKAANARENYEVKIKAREMQEKRLKIEERDFGQGRSSTRELLMAQTDYNTAKLKELNAFYEYIKAACAWNRITGRYDTYYNEYSE